MTDSSRSVAGLPAESDCPPGSYDRVPSDCGMIAEKDVAVAMRDGVNLSIDIYRPDSAEKLPALLAFSIYNKDLQRPDVKKRCRRNRLGPRFGLGFWRPATRSSSSRAAMCTSSGHRAAWENPTVAAVGNGTATI